MTSVLFMQPNLVWTVFLRFNVYKGYVWGYTDLYNKQMLKVTLHVLPLWIWAWNILHGFGNLIIGGNENVSLGGGGGNFRKIYTLKANIWKKMLTKGYFSLGQESYFRIWDMLLVISSIWALIRLLIKDK